MIVAVPMPAPTHSVTSAVASPRRSNSSSTVPRIIAPVAPSGCPIAIAPPFTFSRSGSMSSNCRNSSTTEANASFNSNRSMSLALMPARLSSLRVTFSGPVSMIDGSEPIEVNALIFARGFSPAASPASREPSRIAAAPSTMPEELPA